MWATCTFTVNGVRPQSWPIHWATTVKQIHVRATCTFAVNGVRLQSWAIRRATTIKQIWAESFESKSENMKKNGDGGRTEVRWRIKRGWKRGDDDKGKFDWKKKGWKLPLPNQRDSDLRELSRERERESRLPILIMSHWIFVFHLHYWAKYLDFHFSFPSLWKYSMAPFSWQKYYMRNRFQEKVTGWSREKWNSFSCMCSLQKNRTEKLKSLPLGRT